MQISIVSSLTPEDERRCATVFFKTICSLLDLLPVAYSIHVTTASGRALTRTHSPSEAAGRQMPDLPGAPDPAARFDEDVLVTGKIRPTSR